MKSNELVTATKCQNIIIERNVWAWRCETVLVGEMLNKASIDAILASVVDNIAWQHSSSIRGCAA